MERENVRCCNGFVILDRSETMTVQGGSLEKIVEVVKKAISVIRAIAELSECVDDFIEGYKEGLQEARGY